MIKKGLGIPAIAILILICNISFAQNYSSGKEFKRAEINFSELAKYYKEHPLPLVRKEPMDEDDEEEHRIPHAGDAAHVHMYHPPAQKNTMGPSTPWMPVSPAPNDTFLSSASPGSSIPPDTHGAVDSQYVVTAINTEIRIQDRVGGTISDLSLDAFWSSILPAGTGSFDPRIHYDPYNKRWILVTDAVTNPSFTNSTILIAVSATNDPTGSWHMYAIAVDPTGAAWMDFPNLGYNNKWICVTGNMFPNSTGGASGAVVYLFNYASIMSGTGAPFTRINESASFAMCPAVTYDPTEPNLFVIESWSGNNGQLRLWKVTGAVSSPVISSVGYPATTQHWRGSGPGGGANFATQVGTTNKVDAGDDRITSVVLKNKKLWTTHTVFLPATGTATRSSIQWWQIDTLANPLQIGLINDAATPTFFDYSSIAVNDSNDALIGFGYLNKNMHPSCGYAMHMHTDPIDSTSTPVIFRHGTASYYTTFGGSRNRWGDYSGACLDPRNNMDFWTIQEAANSFGTTANWDTWWANVQICPKPAQPTMDWIGAPCVGDTTSFSILPVAGATSYMWYVGGTGWTGSSTSTTLPATAGTGTGTIVVVAFNSCGQGESHTLHIVPNTTPPAPAISVYTPPCTGVTTAVFTASGTGSSYTWNVVGTGWSGSSSTSTLNAGVGTGTALIICSTSNACGTGAPDTLSITPGTPVTTFTEATHSTLVSVNDLITFTGSAPTGSSFAWSFGGGVATPGTGSGPQSVHWTSTGTKTVTLTVDNFGCNTSYSDTVLVRDLTGTNQINNPAFSISINPNPNDGSFELQFGKPISNSIIVKILDMDGRIVYNQEFGNANNSKIAIKATDLTSGNYLINVLLDGNTVTKKITISR